MPPEQQELSLRDTLESAFDARGRAYSVRIVTENSRTLKFDSQGFE